MRPRSSRNLILTRGSRLRDNYVGKNVELSTATTGVVAAEGRRQLVPVQKLVGLLGPPFTGAVVLKVLSGCLHRTTPFARSAILIRCTSYR